MVTIAEFSAFLSVGANRAITYDAIARKAGVPRRDVEAAAQAARMAGLPFVAGERGAYIAASADELRDYERRLLARIRSQVSGVRGVRRALRGYEGQMGLGL